MAIHDVVIDPNGDTILVLTCPVYGFTDYVDPRDADGPPNMKQRITPKEVKVKEYYQKAKTQQQRELAKFEETLDEHNHNADEENEVKPAYHFLVSSNQLRLVSS
jgi:hypothetical protein